MASGGEAALVEWSQPFVEEDSSLLEVGRRLDNAAATHSEKVSINRFADSVHS